MAVTVQYGECVHCGEAVGLRVYAAPHSSDEQERTYGVKLWTAGAGRYPGDEQICEANVLADDGSYGCHEV